MDSIADSQKNKLIADDGKELMNEKKKFGTFRKNTKAIRKYSNRIEGTNHLQIGTLKEKLLGYSYSHKLAEVFRSSEVNTLLYAQSLENGESARLIGVVEDTLKRKAEKMFILN